MNKIIKGLNVLLLSACSGAVAYGKAVDENTAKIIGCNQLIAANAKGVSTPADLTTAYVATAQAGFGVVVDYYVFNIQGGIGFVMVSGDDKVIPVLAYSTSSSFDYSNLAPATKDWIDGYKNEISAFLAGNGTAQEGTAEQWGTLMAGPAKNAAAKKTVVSPLLSTSWDQEPGYNNLTPVPGGTSASTPTGCVATSIAQVMKFWNWPTVGTGYHSYKAPSYPTVTRTADFGNTAYNWAGMTLTASNTYIATLMSHLGIAVEMNYTPGESGAYTLIAESPVTNCSEYALKTYFHYKRSLHGVQRYDPTVGTGVSTVSSTTWGAMLQAELNAGRPVLYSGQGTSGGHAWVCDGFSSATMFHFNWGWSGLSDGYFTVNSLNPSALGTGGGGGNFNYYQGVIIGIQPDSFASVTGNIKLLAHLDYTVNMPALYPVAAFAVNTKILNSNTTLLKGDFCLQVFDTASKYMFTMATLTGKTIAAGDSLTCAFASTTPLYQMIPGSYKFKVLYRATGATAWTLVANNGTFINENGITVNNGETIELATDITLSSASATWIKKGTALTVSASIGNGTLSTFNGDIRAVFTNVTTGVQTAVGSLVSDVIPYNSISPVYAFTTPSVTVAAGTYTLAIQHKVNTATAFTYTGSDYHQNPVIVTVGIGGVGVNTPSLIADNISVFPNPATSVVNVKLDGGVTASRLTVTDIQGRQMQELTPDANQSTIAIPVNNYAPGIYFVNVFAGEEVVTKKIVVAK